MSGWNGSGQKGATPQKPKATAKKPSPVRGIIAGLVIVLVAVAYFVFFSGSEKPQKEKVKVERAPTTIKQVTPAPAPKAKEEPPVQMVTNRFGKVRPKKKPETYTDEHGVLRYKKGNSRVPMSDEEMHKYLVPQIKRQSNIPEFKHECESEIATLLTVEPGEMVFGDIEHDKR